MNPNEQRQLIATSLKEAADIALAMSKDETLIENIQKAAQLCIAAIQRGNKIFIAGNGGSAADAQHMAAELVGRYMKDRAAIPAIALTTDTSILTAVGNDLGFEDIFARQIEALGSEGDVFIAISTSGKSKNILQALNISEKKGLIRVGVTGGDTSPLATNSDLCIATRSNNTPRIQESHIQFIHVLCELIELALLK